MIGNLVTRDAVVPDNGALRDLFGFRVYLPRGGKRASAMLGRLIPNERTEVPA